MDIMQIGASLLANKIGSGNNDAISSMLGNLLGGEGSGMAGILSAMQGGGLSSIAESWLGDGDNKEISTDQVKNLIGGDKISELASQLNTDEGSLLSGLKDALPQIIDKSSSGGSLLDSIGGLSGALGMAKKFL